MEKRHKLLVQPGKEKVIRDKWIKVRVTPAELEKFRIIALDRGTTISGLIVSILDKAG